MNIDVYFNASPLLGPRTGIGQYCVQLMSAIRNLPDIQSHYYYGAGWSEELLTASAQCQQSRLRGLIRAVGRKIPSFAYTFHHKRHSINFSRGLAGRVRSIYHEPNFLAYRTPLPTVVTVHDLSVLRYPETHPKDRVVGMTARIGESARRADYVITDSEYVRQEVIDELGIPADRVVSVLLAASESFRPLFGDELHAGLHGFGLEAGKYILAVGTLEPRKNLATAIDAYARLPESLRREMPFVIVGMRGWRLDDFDRRTADLIERGQIRQLGYVPDESLPALYSGARVFVYPSLYEGFGLPPLEAMACGAAVIVSDRASLPEVVGNGGIQVDALDAEALSEAMRSIVEDDALRLSLGRRGIEQASRFSWRRCAEQTVEVYRRALA